MLLPVLNFFHLTVVQPAGRLSTLVSRHDEHAAFMLEGMFFSHALGAL